MHIVQVLAALSLGGSELVAIELCEYLCKQGHRVTIIAADGPLRDRVQACGAHHLDWPVGKKKLSSLRLISRLRRWLANNHADVVHAHSRFPAWLTYRTLRSLQPRPALVTSMHGHYSVNAYSAVMAKGDRVIAVSEHMRDYTLKHYQPPAERVVTVHGGIDHAAFPHAYTPAAGWYENVLQAFPQLRGQRWLMLPARVTQWKGHASFLHLLHRLREAQQPVHGLIVGPERRGSSYRATLQRLIARLALAKHVTFTGPQQDMRAWYAAAEIVYNLSDNPPEAFGRTVLEALSTGTPVLAWDQAGPAEQLSKLFPAGKVPVNDLDALTARSIALLEQPVQVPPNMAFTLAASMQATMAVYRQAQNARG